MAMIPYINFGGECKEAVTFYAKAFGVELPQMMFYKDMPPNPEAPFPEGAKDFVMHAMLTVGSDTIMFSDVPPGMPMSKGNNISILISLPDEEKLKSVFDALSEGGEVTMPLQPTFWTKLYGALTDRFGIAWQFNYDEIA